MEGQVRGWVGEMEGQARRQGRGDGGTSTGAGLDRWRDKHGDRVGEMEGQARWQGGRDGGTSTVAG